jgi:hypothetical protein
MTVTDQLSELQGHHSPHIPVSGVPTKLWAADITAVNPDGTIACQPIWSRAGKDRVPVPGSYEPTVGDRVLLANLGGDHQLPIVITALTSAITSSSPPSGPAGGALAGTYPDPEFAPGAAPFLQLLSTMALSIACGSGTVTFTASAFSAQTTVAHGLGRVPVSVACMPGWFGGGNGGGIGESAAADATSFYVEGFLTSAGTATLPFYWIAIG